MSSLQIGSNTNVGNTVEIYKGGTLEIEGAVTVLGTNNGNELRIYDQGTLFVKTNFDAAMGGFNYNAGANLKVGGAVSHLDNVENGLNFTLTGGNASWNFGTNILKVGATTDANSATIADNAQIEIANLSIGSAGSAGNSFIITGGGRASVLDSISILGSGNSLRVNSNGWLEVDMDFDAGMSGFELQTGGGLEAHRSLTMEAISNGVYVVLDGTNALWNRTGLSLDIGAFSDDNQLTITNNGTVRADRIQIGATNNAVLITDGGNLVLEGNGSYINADNSLTLVQGGRLTVKSNFWDAIDWHDDAFFYWGNGGILECQGAAPIFSSYTINGQYIEYGTLFLRDGQILMLNGSNAVWNAADHNLYIGDVSSGNALIVTNGGFAEVKSMTIGESAEQGGNNNYALISGTGSEIYSHEGVGLGAWHDLGVWYYNDGGSNNTLRLEDGGTLTTDGNFYMGGSGNTLSIDGAASELNVAGDLIFTGTNQLIDLSNGAALTNDNIQIAFESSTIRLAGNAQMSVSNLTLGGDGSAVFVSDGSVLTNGGALSMTGDDGLILVDGAGSLLSAAGNMTLTGTNFYLGALDGAVVTSGGALSMTGDGGNIYVDSNARIEAAGDITLDGIRLELAQDGWVTSGGTLYNQNTSAPSEIYLQHGALVEAADYYQASGAILSYDIGNTPTNLGRLAISDTAEFAAGAEIGLYGSLTNLAMNITYTNTLLAADTLIVGGKTNAATADLAQLDTASGSLVNFALFVQDQDIVAILNRIALSQSAGFAPGSMMGNIANEIDNLSLNGNTAAANQINILNGMSGTQQNDQLNQLYAYQLPTYMHNQSLLGGMDQARARGASFHNTPWELITPPEKSAAGLLQSSRWNQSAASRKPAPKPNSAPELQQATNQTLQGWIKVYGGYGNRDSKDSGYENGYDLQSGGTVIGFDKTFGQCLFGAAGGYAESQLEGDNGDESDATTGYGVLYASYGNGTSEWFGDIVASYGLSDIDNDSGSAFDVSSSTEAKQTALYVGGGKEFKEKGSPVLLHLLTGLQVSLYDQDAYTEKSPNAVAKDVEAYERWNYQSILGAVFIVPSKAGSGLNMETRVRAGWLHEFNDDEEKVNYTLVGSTQPGQFVMRSPDQDVAQVGIGCAAKLKHGMQLQADLDSQIGETVVFTTISAGLLCEF